MTTVYLTIIGALAGLLIGAIWLIHRITRVQMWVKEDPNRKP